jgi:ABC-type phosphate/phosphonate transport system substrate-binding protein
MNTRIVSASAVAAVLAVGIGAITVNAADTGTHVALLAPSQPDRAMPQALALEDEVITFSAPPRDSEEEGRRRFEPLAEYLSKTLGKKVVYRHPGSWGVYQGAMQKGAYDLVFDGPHFNGWRMEKLDYSVLVKAPGDFSQVVVVRKDNTASDLKRLAGRKVCAHEPPNLGTLIMQGAFDNPARQPLIVVVHGYKHIYQALLDGKCEAAVLPKKHLEKFDRERGAMRVVYQSKPLPNQALSAGPRISAEDRVRIAAALLAPEAAAPTAKMREAYMGGKPFVATSNAEYAGLGKYLSNEWGYY